MVCYHDGSSLAQTDSSSPEFNHEAGEVPFKVIDWPRVSQLRLESMYGYTTYNIVQPGEEFTLSLRRRTFITMDKKTISAFVLLVSLVGSEVGASSVVSAHYWLPNLIDHSCSDFDCADIRRYAVQSLSGDTPSLVPATEKLHIAATVITT